MPADVRPDKGKETALNMWGKNKEKDLRPSKMRTNAGLQELCGERDLVAIIKKGGLR
jgi:hypothetical protein